MQPATFCWALAGARLATRHLAQRDEPSVERALCGAARDARPRLAQATTRARGVGALRTRPRATPRIKTYLVALSATTSLRALVRLAHHRWAIEQQYEELKDELGLDHYEGRSFVGWHRHVVLTAMAYAWLQDARRRAAARLPTLPVARAVITKVLTARLFVTRLHYLRTMQKLAEINLRICSENVSLRRRAPV